MRRHRLTVLPCTMNRLRQRQVATIPLAADALTLHSGGQAAQNTLVVGYIVGLCAVRGKSTCACSLRLAKWRVQVGQLYEKEKGHLLLCTSRMEASSFLRQLPVGDYGHVLCHPDLQPFAYLSELVFRDYRALSEMMLDATEAAKEIASAAPNAASHEVPSSIPAPFTRSLETRLPQRAGARWSEHEPTQGPKWDVPAPNGRSSATCGSAGAVGRGGAAVGIFVDHL